MTIQKGRDWGESATVPFNVVVANDETGLARVVANALQSGSVSTSVDVPRIALRTGNLLTTLGIASGSRLSSVCAGEPCRLLPCDAYEITLTAGRRTVTTVAVSTVLVGSAVNPIWWLTSGGFVGGLNVAPNSHPNDGRADALVWGAMRLRDVLAIRRRMRLGSHLPHPALEMQRGSTLRWQSSQGRRRVMIDGRNYGRADAVSVTVRPDAFTLVVTATQE